MKGEYALFTGCLIPARYPHIEAVARTVLPEMGYQLVSDLAFSCCPDPIQVGGVDYMTWLAIAARNLAVAEKCETSILTLCNGCTNTLAIANTQLKRSETLRKKVNGYLRGTERRYQGTIEVKHFLKSLWEDIGVEMIKSRIKNPLKGLKVATHSGCHLLSPVEVMQFDNPRDPTRFDRLVQSLGAEVIEYEKAVDCCGVSLALMEDQEGAVRAVREKLTSIQDEGADGLVVGCPFCFQQFDLMQTRVRIQGEGTKKVPIFFYLQLLGIAIGLSVESMELSSHKIRNRVLEIQMEGL